MENERFEEIEDLINSDLFCEWVFSQKHIDFWQRWQANNPKRQAMLVEATTFLEQFSFHKKEARKAEIDADLATIWSKMEEQPAIKKPSVDSKPIAKKMVSFKALGIAASILFLFAVGWLGLQHFASANNVYVTNFGETEKITLPDNSQVVLQANSSLKVPKNWSSNTDRKVWLEGQAFFSVTKKQTTQPIKFEVKTTDFTVEVLGTEFDVLHRKDHKRVVLQEGKVKLNWGSKQEINLVPNEMVTFLKAANEYKKSKVNSTAFTAWTEQKLILNNTPLSEIARILEDNYGYEISISTTVNQSKTRSSLGPIDLKNIDNLIQVMETSYDVVFLKKGKQIEIK